MLGADLHHHLLQQSHDGHRLAASAPGFRGRTPGANSTAGNHTPVQCLRAQPKPRPPDAVGGVVVDDDDQIRAFPPVGTEDGTECRLAEPAVGAAAGFAEPKAKRQLGAGRPIRLGRTENDLCQIPRRFGAAVENQTSVARRGLHGGHAAALTGLIRRVLHALDQFRKSRDILGQAEPGQNRTQPRIVDVGVKQADQRLAIRNHHRIVRANVRATFSRSMQPDLVLVGVMGNKGSASSRRNP